MDKQYNMFDFGSILNAMPAKPKVTKSEDIKKVHAAAEAMYAEDSIEREAKKGNLQSVIVSPDVESAGDRWVVVALFENKSANRDPMNLILGGISSATIKKVAYFESFIHAVSFLEKNKFFKLKTTKWVEGIYASWDA